MDLRPVMNPTPSMVLHSTSLPQMFRRFRALGLVSSSSTGVLYSNILVLSAFKLGTFSCRPPTQRHMLVTNDNNEVVGVVTRKDLARFRVVHRGSRMAREVVRVTEQVTQD